MNELKVGDTAFIKPSESHSHWNVELYNKPLTVFKITDEQYIYLSAPIQMNEALSQVSWQMHELITIGNYNKYDIYGSEVCPN